MSDFSRRERQIMNIVFARQGATVREICEQLPDPPTPMAVRRMLAILLEKGHLKRKPQGREFVYLPKTTRQKAGLKAFRQVLETFFDGSLGAAVATHLQKPGGQLSDEDIVRLSAIIEEAAAQADEGDADGDAAD